MVLYSVFRAIAKPIAHLIFKLNYEGAENVPSTGRVILAPNHQTAIDPGLIAIGLNRPFTAMAKEELFDKRFTAWLLGKLGAFPTKRGVADMSSIDFAVNLLRGENAFLIFPEGTRSPDNPLKQIKSGAVAISVMAQAPVIPVAIDAPDGIKLFKKITVRYGKPIQYWEFGITEFRSKQYRAAKELLLNRMKELKNGNE